MPELPNEAALTLAPDWVCEVLSPSTRHVDLTDKREIYQREGVTHLWFIDADATTLEVRRLDPQGYVVVAAWRDAAIVRAEPFDAIELPLAVLWET